MSWPHFSTHIIRHPFIFRLRLQRKLRNGAGGSNNTRPFSVSDWREVSDIVGDYIVRVATDGAMIERIIFRIRREFSSRGFGYLLTALTKQIDESPSRVSRDFETPQDLTILGKNLLGVKPSEDFRIVAPGQHKPQFWSVWFRRLLAERCLAEVGEGRSRLRSVF